MVDFIVQALAAVLLFFGLWSMGNNQLRGPFVTMVAEIFTTAVGIMHHTWSIILIGTVLAFVQGRNFLKWRKEGIAW
jgi:hypothetical protein